MTTLALPGTPWHLRNRQGKCLRHPPLAMGGKGVGSISDFYPDAGAPRRLEDSPPVDTTQVLAALARVVHPERRRDIVHRRET